MLPTRARPLFVFTLVWILLGLVPSSLPGTPSPWTDLGGAAPGAHGPPRLTAVGSLTAGSILDINLKQTEPDARMLTWLSFTSAPLNILGGTIHAYPFDVQLVRTAFGDGTYSESVVWPPGIPAGIEMYLQFLIVDFSVPSQLTLSNALMATTP